MGLWAPQTTHDEKLLIATEHTVRFRYHRMAMGGARRKTDNQCQAQEWLSLEECKAAVHGLPSHNIQHRSKLHGGAIHRGLDECMLQLTPLILAHSCFICSCYIFQLIRILFYIYSILNTRAALRTRLMRKRYVSAITAIEWIINVHQLPNKTTGKHRVTISKV